MPKVKEDNNSKGRYYFFCKGCNENHYIPTSPKDKLWGKNRWTFNGNVDKPTFKPSILIRSGHYAENKPMGNCWCDFQERYPEIDNSNGFKCCICHSFVTDGKIQYLSDCTHEYAGQTIDLEDLIVK